MLLVEQFQVILESTPVWEDVSPYLTATTSVVESVNAILDQLISEQKKTGSYCVFILQIGGQSHFYFC